jgi:hypothetical protein
MEVVAQGAPPLAGLVAALEKLLLLGAVLDSL